MAIDPGRPEAHYTLGMIYKDKPKLDDSVMSSNKPLNRPAVLEAV